MYRAVDRDEMSRRWTRIGEALRVSFQDIINRVHQRQHLPALIAVSYVGVEELGFIREEAGPVTLARRRSGPLLTGDENDVDLAVEIGVG